MAVFSNKSKKEDEQRLKFAGQILLQGQFKFSNI